MEFLKHYFRLVQVSFTLQERLAGALSCGTEKSALLTEQVTKGLQMLV